MIELLSRPWPWWVGGPLIGLTVPLLLVLGNKQFGVSANLRHLCAAICPGEIEFFKYDWKKIGLWNLTFVAGIFVGGLIAGWLLAGPPPQVSPETQVALARLGVTTGSGLVPMLSSHFVLFIP